MRRLTIIIMLIALIIQTQPVAAAPFVNGYGALVMEMKSGQVLWSQNAEERMYPASTTKILTALLVIENAKLDDIVTVSSNAYGVEGSSIYLSEGEQQTVEDLLYALMLVSANDVAVALAEHVSGSVEAFTKLMNERAQQLGAKNSHFVNPHGLHDPDHYTTPHYLALIARGAMANPTFRQLVKTEERQIPWPGQPWPRELYNHNRLLGTYEGMLGVKNGFTDEAMQTFVGAAQRQGHEILSVVMRTDHIWEDTEALLDYGFQEVETRAAVEPGTSYQVGDYQFTVNQALKYDTAKGRFDSLVLKLQLPDGTGLTDLPLGSKEARLDLYQADVKVGSASLTLQKKPSDPWYHKWWVWAVVFIVVLRLRVMVRRMFRRRRQTAPIRIAQRYGDTNFRQ
ncbi:MAG: D-alanyl-D-alanine carboxypeptidase family protein [Bacillota bacterium]